MAYSEKRGKSYRIRASIGYRIDGRQVQPSKTWTPDPDMTPKQIEKELRRQEVLFDEECRSAAVQDGHVKFGRFIDQYLEEYAKTTVRHKTLEGYERLKPRVVEGLGHLYLDKVTPRQIKTFINGLGRPGANQLNGKPLSPKSQKNYLSFISSILNYAVNMELISENPCSKVPAPASAPKGRDWYTVEEAQALLDSLTDAPLKYQAFFTLAIFCGYRREELCGFEWSDINFDARMIAVNRASLYTKERGTYTDVPKTESSRRVLKQPQVVFDVLRRWRAEQAQQRLIMGDAWKRSNRLFPRLTGLQCTQIPLMPGLKSTAQSTSCASWAFTHSAI